MWCKMDRGRGDSHSASSAPTIPTLGGNYFFITKDAVAKRSELLYPVTAEGEVELENDRTAGSVIKCLAVRDTSTK